jgi:hypothetical protein
MNNLNKIHKNTIDLKGSGIFIRSETYKENGGNSLKNSAIFKESEPISSVYKENGANNNYNTIFKERDLLTSTMYYNNNGVKYNFAKHSTKNLTSGFKKSDTIITDKLNTNRYKIDKSLLKDPLFYNIQNKINILHSQLKSNISKK